MASIRDKIIDELADEVDSFYRDALSLSPDEFDANEKPDEKLMERAVSECLMNKEDIASFHIQLGRIECLQTVLGIICDGKPWAKTKHEKNLMSWAVNLSLIEA